MRKRRKREKRNGRKSKTQGMEISRKLKYKKIFILDKVILDIED